MKASKSSLKGIEKEHKASDSKHLPEDDEMFKDQDIEFEKNHIPEMQGMQTEIASEDEAIDTEGEFKVAIVMMLRFTPLN
jgi:hypothetical protein